MSKSLAIQNAQRAAFHRLADPMHKKHKHVEQHHPQHGKMMVPHHDAHGNPTIEWVKNDWHVKPDNITCPSIIVQELPFDGSTNSLVFDFSQTAPQPTAALNNVLLGINNIACIYGIQVLFGVGANGNTRKYYTHGLLGADNALYSGSTMSFQFEQSQLVKNIDMQDFNYEQGTDYIPEETIKLVNPLRLITGRLGTNTVTINMQSLTGLTFTPNAFVSVRLQTVLGQASGTN